MGFKTGMFKYFNELDEDCSGFLEPDEITSKSKLFGIKDLCTSRPYNFKKSTHAMHHRFNKCSERKKYIYLFIWKFNYQDFVLKMHCRLSHSLDSD